MSKVLSIKQPWASLIAHGIKDIENRSWKTNYRGRIYIHASSDNKGFLSLLNKKQVEDLRNKSNLEFKFPHSAIIGEVDIIDCVQNHHSIWAEHFASKKIEDGTVISVPIYNWVLANPVLYDTPILNVKGKLSFWDYEILENINHKNFK